MKAPMRAQVGQTMAPRRIGPITQSDIVRFAGAGGDFNPLHHDPEYAARAGFDRPIAMGQMTAGLLAAWLTDSFGVEHLTSLEVRFQKPLIIGDVIDITGTIGDVRAVEADGADTAVVFLQAVRGDDVLASATAKVRVFANA